MTTHYLIQGARVPQANMLELCDVRIQAGNITAIGPQLAAEGAHVIAANGKLLSLGLCDLSVRLFHPQNARREPIDQLLQLALQSGVTAFVVPPDTQPIPDESRVIEMLHRRVADQASVKVLPLGALTRQLAGVELAPLFALAQAGCVGFGQGWRSISHLENLRRALLYAHSFGYCTWLHPIHPELTGEGVAHESALSTRMGLIGIPPEAESVALLIILELVRKSGARVHFCRLSSARGVELIRVAKAQGLPVTADVSILHLLHNEFDLGYFDPRLKLTPPLRGQTDQAALTAGVIDGTIDAICSDHMPLSADDKALPFAQALSGAATLPYLFSLAWHWAQHHSVAPQRVLDALTVAPTAITGQSIRFEVGQSADLCLFDPDALLSAPAQTLASLPQLPLLGAVTHTWINGNLIYERAQT